MFGKLNRLYRKTKETKDMEVFKKAIYNLFAGKKCFVRYSIVDQKSGNIDHYCFTQNFPKSEMAACQQAQHGFIAAQLEGKIT